MSYIGAQPTTGSFPFDQFSGDGSTTAFTLTYAPASTTSIIVAISGVVQNPNLYSIIGTTITFSPAPPAGTNNISVLYLGLPVQIGTPIPGSTLQLALGSAANPSLTFIGDTNTGIYSPGADTIAFVEGGVEAMRVDTSGNVGIGTSSPTDNLQVSGSGNRIIGVSCTGTGAAGLELLSSGSNGFIGYNADLRFGTITGLGAAGFTERMRIDSSGNLCVGVTSTSARMQIDGAGSTSAGNTVVVRNSAPTNMFVIRNDGYFQTGTAASSPYNATTGSAANCFINSDGGLYRSTSSLKYKNNVQDATYGLADLLALRSVTYESKAKSDAGKVFGGLIAEEVHDAGLTEFVQYADDGSPDALAYGNMVSLCIKAIQEQQAMIETMKQEIAELKGLA
jgi:hypothetical protein